MNTLRHTVPKTRMSFWLPADLRSRIAHQSRNQSRSMGNVLVLLIERGLAAEAETKAAETGAPQ